MNSANFPALLADFCAEEFAEHPTLASALGAPGHDEELGDFTAAAFERRDRRDREWHAAFGAVAAAGLSTVERTDRDLVLTALRGRVLLAERASWRCDPMVYLGPIFGGLHTLFLHRLRPEPELVAAAVSRLRQVPAVVAALRANLDPDRAARLIIERAVNAAAGGGRFCREGLPALVPYSDGRATVAAASAEAADALDGVARWLSELAPTATGDWRMGEPLYTALLRERELLDLDAAALCRRGEAAYTELDAEMSEIAATVSGGDRDWRAVLATLRDDHPPTMEAMREEYAAATAAARAFLAEHDLVPFADGEKCRVVPAPEFQRPVLAVASYQAPPGLTPGRIGHFFVPYTVTGAPADEVAQRLRANGRAGMPTISVHEAYPGHHWHATWAAGHTTTVRKFLRTPYFSEGWALYAERVMREHGFFADPRHDLAHLDARIFRAVRIMVDVGLHTGELTVEEAVARLDRDWPGRGETNRAEVLRYCSWPTQAAAYLTGCLEIERIRADWRRANPGVPLKDFHAALAGSGALPLGLAARVVTTAAPEVRPDLGGSGSGAG